jgi:ribonuclease BN (tRNA processing enzyme)
MRLIFPGTKGEIEEQSPKHRFHSSLIVEYLNTRILIDLGEKYSTSLEKKINSFDALLITHAHPDHYIWTLREENRVKIPVYLTKATLEYSQNKPLNTNLIEDGRQFVVKDLKVTPFNVIHSLRCPAICFKIEGDRAVLYAPDILDTEQPKKVVFSGVSILIADGSSIDVNLVRRRDDKLFGHAMIKTIINWCRKYNINELIITHCGKQVVTGDEKEIMNKIFKYAEIKINIQIAYDGFKIDI